MRVQVIEKLIEFEVYQAKCRDVKKELRRLAVECGMDQAEALKGSFVDFLRGYISNKGVCNEND
jgi:hypothetical protein